MRVPPTSTELAALRLAVRERLELEPGGIGEYELLRGLKSHAGVELPADIFADALELFRAHFVLFHCLYELRDELIRQRRGVLSIHCLRIVIGAFVEPVPGIEEHDPMRPYYADLGNLGATRHELERMLADFWRRFSGRSDREDALRIFGLDDRADAKLLRRRYRELALQHHPDRGGDPARMARINAAMAKLRCALP